MHITIALPKVFLIHVYYFAFTQLTHRCWTLMHPILFVVLALSIISRISGMAVGLL